jgi:hypothetical protein
VDNVADHVGGALLALCPLGIVGLPPEDANQLSIWPNADGY